eukprot:EC687734.1.p1 GENE.EC687734.1~~EC687734.1.p1  ORF type:complete len:216 (+),score=117.91 EC687734.1:52-699(+)
MMDMLKQVGRSEIVVGWYHSHPGFGCWLSSVDLSTQESFEQLNPRAVAVVVDPIQSVKGKVVIDAFRSIKQQYVMMQIEPRQTTSNIGQLNKPSIAAIVHGLDRQYYNMPVTYRKNDLEVQMLNSLHRKEWHVGLLTEDFKKHADENAEKMLALAKFSKQLAQMIEEENTMDAKEFSLRHVGKVNAEKHLERNIEDAMTSNIVQTLGTMLDTVLF